MINKYFTQSLAEIKTLSTDTIYKLEVDNELLNGYDIDVQKDDSGYAVTINFKPFKGFSSNQLTAIKFMSPIKLLAHGRDYYLPKNALLFNSYSTDFAADEHTVIVGGSINQISTAEHETSFDGKYLRLIIPVPGKRPRLQDIRGFHYETDVPANETILHKVVINSIEYHFYGFKIDGVMHLGVDTTTRYNLKDFRHLSHSIINAFGFLFGDLFLDEGYILSSENSDFTEIENVYFSTYRESLLTGLSIYTTNPYSIYNVTGKSRQEIDEQITEIKKWYSKILEIEGDLFSRLCELFFNTEPISRAAIVTLQGNLLALEIKGSAYSAALEAITSIIMDENKGKYPNPIEDKAAWKILLGKFLSALDEEVPDVPGNEETREIMKNKLKMLNKISNASKLKNSFVLMGYSLKDYEFEAIKARDKFQHGELPVKKITEDAVFREVYYICLILHRLIYILILKRIGFDGYIINYPQLHSHITNKDLEEDLLYKI